jgi:hypothetical protein
MSLRESLPETVAGQPPAQEPSQKTERKRPRHTACNRTLDTTHSMTKTNELLAGCKDKKERVRAALGNVGFEAESDNCVV